MGQEITTTVLIIGAGPAGLATVACLNLEKIPNIILEREDCCASLWKKKSYDRLKLHLDKQFCDLPHKPFPPNAPTYVPKNGFVQYLNDYVSDFDISPMYGRRVICARCEDGNWTVVAINTVMENTEKYRAKFLVLATGENSEGYIPAIEGLESFNGEVMHSSCYRNGERFKKRDVLVVGSGNSGMEIAFDLCCSGALTSVVVRSPVHILTGEMVRLGMVLLKSLPVDVVDNVVLTMSKLKYGNLEDYGIKRPTMGPFYLKMTTGRSPVIDVGTLSKIQSQQIQVLPSIRKVNGNYVHFINGEKKSYDAIVFATGYRSTVRKWLQDDGGLFGEDGMPKQRVPNHWKGENGLYCVGFARTGLRGISKDAQAVLRDIIAILANKNIN